LIKMARYQPVLANAADLEFLPVTGIGGISINRISAQQFR